jgi:U3 small nucleolar RNA-associated protein 3
VHPILRRLLVLKQSLSILESLDFGPAHSDISGLSDIGEEDSDIEGDMANVWGSPGFHTFLLENGELTELLRDAQLQSPEPNDLDHPKEKKKRKAKEEKEGGKKQKKAKKADKKTERAFDLVEPEFIPSSSKLRSSASTAPTAKLSFSQSAYGESIALDAIDAEDKSARKRSLRFHTSTIESTAARRANARNIAKGGDDDIPYRERNKEREARLKKEAEARLKKGPLGQGGDDLDDVEMKDGGEDETKKGKKRRREEMEEEDAGEDGYYELVKRQKKEKKELKKTEYEAEKAAERCVFTTILVPHQLTVFIEWNEKATKSPQVVLVP